MSPADSSKLQATVSETFFFIGDLDAPFHGTVVHIS